MVGETAVTIIGNLTADPELRYTQAGAPVFGFTVASTPRAFDRQSGTWKDAPAVFLRCTAWNELAENLAESVSKGTRLIVQGRLKPRSFESRSGETHHVLELEVDAAGPELRWATAKVTKNTRAAAEQPEPAAS